MSNTTRATAFGGLTLAAIVGLMCLVVWLQGQKPAPILDEGRLTARQEHEKKSFLDRHMVEVLKTSSGTPIYLLTCRNKNCRDRQEELTTKRPDWVSEDGKVVLEQGEKEWVAMLGPATPPPWMRWMDGQYVAWQIETAIAGLQIMAVLFAIAGVIVGFCMSCNRYHPALWWAPVGASLIVSLMLLNIPGGLAFFNLATWSVAIAATLCFAIPGGFFFAALRSLENWPRREEEEEAKPAKTS